MVSPAWGTARTLAMVGVVWLMGCGDSPITEDVAANAVGVRFVPPGDNAPPLDLAFHVPDDVNADVLVPSLMSATHAGLGKCTAIVRQPLALKIRVDKRKIAAVQVVETDEDWSCLAAGMQGADIVGMPGTQLDLHVFVRPG